MPRVRRQQEGNHPPTAVYIGRKNGGDWTQWYGNPFTHLNTPNRAMVKVATRDDSVRFFRMLVILEERDETWGQLADLSDEQMALLEKQGEWIRANLHNLKDRDLICWCYPLSCHGDVLFELANKEGDI